jgi:inhibitor of KinA
MPSSPRLLTAGDCALVVEYGNAIDAKVNARVRLLDARLAAAAPAGILETVPTYRSLMVHYDPLTLRQADIERLVREADSAIETAGATESRLVEIPVMYGGPFGPDLADVAALNGLSADEVVAIHAAGEYPVFMLGFMPGFPYLGGMSARIRASRLSTPRTAVPAGSVGIAGDQTGIYPAESPGGWRLIGRTPVRLFDAMACPPALLAAGDRVRFRPISPGEFDEITRDVAAGTFVPISRAAR